MLARVRLVLDEAAQQAVARQERERAQRRQVAGRVEHGQLQPQHAVQAQGRCDMEHYNWIFIFLGVDENYFGNIKR